MYSRTLPALALLLLTGGVLIGQTSRFSSSDKLEMHQHYDAAYRWQSLGNIAQADVEHKRFLLAALDHLANFYANIGDYLHAAPIYEESLQLSTNNVASLMDYVGASLDAHDLKKARALLKTVSELDANNMSTSQKADVYLMWGKVLRASGDTKAAIDQFQSAIAIDPNIDNYDALARAILEVKGVDGASPIFATIVARFGDSASVHMQIGRSYALSGFPDRAIEEFKKAIARDYRMPGLHYSLGAAYMSDRASKLPLAEAEFRKELVLHPNDTYSYPQLGYIALRRLDYHEAEGDFQRAIAASPLNAQVFADLGKLYVDTGRPAQAEAAFRKAITLTIDPSRNEYSIERVHYQLGRLLITRGNESEGQRELQIAQELLSQRDLQAEMKLNGESVQHSPLETTRIATPKEVEDLKRFAKQVGPLIAGSYNNLGVHAAMGNEYAVAAGYFKLAEKWDSTLTGVDRNWGMAAFGAHDCAQAIEPLRRAVADDLSNTELAAMLNQCRSLVSVTTEGEKK